MSPASKLKRLLGRKDKAEDGPHQTTDIRGSRKSTDVAARKSTDVGANGHVRTLSAFASPYKDTVAGQAPEIGGRLSQSRGSALHPQARPQTAPGPSQVAATHTSEHESLPNDTDRLSDGKPPTQRQATALIQDINDLRQLNLNKDTNIAKESEGLRAEPQELNHATSGHSAGNTTQTSSAPPPSSANARESTESKDLPIDPLPSSAPFPYPSLQQQTKVDAYDYVGVPAHAQQTQDVQPQRSAKEPLDHSGVVDDVNVPPGARRSPSSHADDETMSFPNSQPLKKRFSIPRKPVSDDVPYSADAGQHDRRLSGEQAPGRDRDYDQHREATQAAVAGVLDLSDTKDTSVHETVAPAVTHQHIERHEHHIYEEQITRDIHEYHVVHRALPVNDIQWLPARHFVIGADGRKIEIIDEDVPGLTGGVHAQADIWFQRYPTVLGAGNDGLVNGVKEVQNIQQPMNLEA